MHAHASVGVCEQVLASQIFEDSNELAAKKRAIEDWGARAKQLGEQYTRWGIAWNRQLGCSPTESGVFRCQAIGHPCAIMHVPPPPGDTIPFRRGTPR